MRIVHRCLLPGYNFRTFKVRLQTGAVMKAIIIRQFGGPEELVEADMPKPHPGAGQVLVKLKATSINPVDYKIRTHGSWAGVPLPGILGYDAAGIVEELGAGVTNFKQGDEVYYSAKIFGRQGTYAEYHVEDADIVHKKPVNLSFEQAASLPLAGCTAWDSVIRLIGIQPGQTILIHAGAGGVGSLAVQIAAAAGARVISTCRTENNTLVRSLGAWQTIDYRNTSFEKAIPELTNGELIDAVFDTVGGDTVARSIGLVKPYGRIATCVGVSGDLNGALSRNLSLHFEFMERSYLKMHAIDNLVTQGKLKTLIDSIHPLSEVANAHRKSEAGGVKGKIVIKI